MSTTCHLTRTLHKETIVSKKNYKIENREVSKLIPYVNNSRIHGNHQVKQIAASITEFGFTSPLLIDSLNNVIAGHGRLLACELLGIKEVPCVLVAGLTEAQKKALVIADNKIAENSDWDIDLLRLELTDLDSLDFNYAELGLDFNFDIVDDIEEDFAPDMPSGDREPIRNMTFTVSDEQHEIIEECLKLAKEYPLQDPAGINENSNGNALYYICEVFKNNVS